MKMNEIIAFIKLWIWFFVFGLIESATIFQTPNRFWLLILIVNFLLSVIMIQKT